MSRRGENIHKRKDGRWEARITIQGKEGFSKKKSLYGKTYKEAKDKLLNAKAYLENNSMDQNKKSKTLAEAAEEWFHINRIKQKASTQLKYRTMAEKHILPVLGAIELQKLDEAVINDFLVQKLNNTEPYRDKGLSASYVKTMGVILNSIINYAVDMDYRNPLKSKIIKPSETKNDITIMSRNSQLDLERALLYRVTPTAVGIMLALQAGLRIGEISALRWDEIDLETKIIHVRHTIVRIKNDDESLPAKTRLVIDEPKTKTSYRDIPINTRLMNYLLKARLLSKSEYVVSEKSSFISPRTFEYRFHKILDEFGIEKINFHALRHTFATRCVEQGVDVKTLSEILGHANVGITLNTYVHSSIDMKRNQIEKIAML